MTVAHTLQEHEDHHQHQQKSLAQRFFDFLDVLADVLGGVVGDAVFQSVGEALGQVVHVLAHLADDIEGIGVGILVHRQRAGRLPVQPPGGIVVFRVELDPGDVAQLDDRAVVVAADDDFLEFRHAREPPLDEDRVFLDDFARRHRLAADPAGGRLAILRLDRGDHLARLDELGRHAVGIEPDPHRVFAPNTATSLTPETRFSTSAT